MSEQTSTATGIAPAVPWMEKPSDSNGFDWSSLPVSPTEGMQVGTVSSAKVVNKPWGREYWIVPEGAPFGFKIIYLKAGTRSSLQFHRKKEEANIILRGEGVLRFGDGSNGPSGEIVLQPGMTVHVRPGAVHRFSATTDLVMVECSTTELDDVVRINDDLGRPDGRIATEHDGKVA
jgi:mannose-6-phosphate isomerase-like protein (cupin superfamily)